MAQSANPLEGHLECHRKLKSPADKVYNIFRRECFKFPEIMPLEIVSVKLINGNTWDSRGSERLWTFKDVDNCGTWEDIVTAISDQTKSITFTLKKGEVPERSYKSLNVKFQFSPDGEGCMAEAVLTFVKNNVNVPDPKDYIDFIHDKMFPDVDDYIQSGGKKA